MTNGLEPWLRLYEAVLQMIVILGDKGAVAVGDDCILAVKKAMRGVEASEGAGPGHAGVNAAGVAPNEGKTAPGKTPMKDQP
jgi:hypothetical protein